MNTLEALRNHCLHAEQASSLRRPIARAAGAVFLTGDNHERHAFGLVTHSCVVDAHALAVGLVHRDTTFDTRHHQVLDAHVCKRAAHHHLVIATSRAVAVEVPDFDTAVLQI